MGRPKANANVPFRGGASAAELRAWVVMVRVEATGPFVPGVTAAGLKLQAAPAGSPAHEKVTGSLKAPIAVTEAVTVADWPAFRVADVALRLKWKSRAGSGPLPLNMSEIESLKKPLATAISAWPSELKSAIAADAAPPIPKSCRGWKVPSPLPRKVEMRISATTISGMPSPFISATCT